MLLLVRILVSQLSAAQKSPKINLERSEMINGKGKEKTEVVQRTYAIIILNFCLIFFAFFGKLDNLTSLSLKQLKRHLTPVRRSRHCFFESYFYKFIIFFLLNNLNLKSNSNVEE